MTALSADPVRTHFSPETVSLTGSRAVVVLTVPRLIDYSTSFRGSSASSDATSSPLLEEHFDAEEAVYGVDACAVVTDASINSLSIPVPRVKHVGAGVA